MNKVENFFSVRYRLNYDVSGNVVISANDDCNEIVDAMLATEYNREFCVSSDFSLESISRMMEAGFLVMSVKFDKESTPEYILLPKLHLVRSVLIFVNLHIKKTIRRFIKHFELRLDIEFDRIIDLCVEKHGDDWLTAPLVECIKKIRYTQFDSSQPESERILPSKKPKPVSFSLYHDGKLVAGEFGVICGYVYTSYSGFHDMDNSGTVQIILTAQYLQNNGFILLDFGMPMEYKNDLGAKDVNPYDFVQLFRYSQWDPDSEPEYI